MSESELTTSTPSKPTTDLIRGLELGPFVLEDCQGRTSTFQLWAARRSELGSRPLDLLVLDRNVGSSAGAELFVKRTRTLSSLRNPHVLRAYSAQQIEGWTFAVLDRDMGVPLARILDGGSLEWGDAVAVSRALVVGVGALHRQQLAHGALSPNALSLSEDGRILLGAFGTLLTTESMNFRADVRAVAALCWTLLAGRPPLRGEVPTPSEQKTLRAPEVWSELERLLSSTKEEVQDLSDLAQRFEALPQGGDGLSARIRRTSPDVSDGDTETLAPHRSELALSASSADPTIVSGDDTLLERASALSIAPTVAPMPSLEDSTIADTSQPSSALLSDLKAEDPETVALLDAIRGKPERSRDRRPRRMDRVRLPSRSEVHEAVRSVPTVAMENPTPDASSSTTEFVQTPTRPIRPPAEFRRIVERSSAEQELSQAGIQTLDLSEKGAGYVNRESEVGTQRESESLWGTGLLFFVAVFLGAMAVVLGGVLFIG